MKRSQTTKELSLEEITAQLTQHVQSKNLPEFYKLVKELRPYDLSLIYKKFPEDDINRFLLLFKPDILADLAENLKLHEQAELFERLGPERTLEVMQQMDKSDLIRFMHDLPAKRREELLSSMNLDHSAIIRSVLSYPPETAGRIMTDRYRTLFTHDTAKEALRQSQGTLHLSASSYLYVTDNEGKLAGVVSYRSLALADDKTKVEELMTRRVIHATVDMDQEEAAQLLQRYEFMALPVVDENNRLCGIIQMDDVIDIIMDEASEDLAKMGGGGKDIDFDTKPLVAVRRRLPWLILLLLIGLISGSIVDFFEDTLNQVVALAFFMPMIAGMTGNTGTQSLAVVVRGLIGRKLDRATVLALIIREIKVGMMIGLVCGVLITVIAYIWQGDWLLGMIIGVSLFFTLIIGTLTGTCIPLLLSRFKVDPAVASGPLITTLNDILSLFIYFGIATRFIGALM
ncbi:magnesium transporter [Paenibacillus silvae]|uniref:magnesium transporter n=1 Tax=Paenibacillus silvae TaxID=1325358 RepID=UPI002005730D|nr:magnesium transporter [Paenibacillus silvae]MCK6075055.1 magnesium transporter [Paenibacillus silvae]MCK6149442.1 magnesium transporter [Paenibacillus silvae]MCK6267741.1 magnesium transporter [Paenibacillus silvae]